MGELVLGAELVQSLQQYAGLAHPVAGHETALLLVDRLLALLDLQALGRVNHVDN